MKTLSNSYLDPYSKPNENISFPRNTKTNGVIDSKNFNLNSFQLFQDRLIKWILIVNLPILVNYI